MTQSPSEPHPCQLDDTQDETRSMVTSDPLIPKPVGTGDSNVVSTSSPVAGIETTSQWKKPEQLQHNQGFIAEESTQVWKNKAKQQQGDIEKAIELKKLTSISASWVAMIEDALELAGR